MEATDFRGPGLMLRQKLRLGVIRGILLFSGLLHLYHKRQGGLSSSTVSWDISSRILNIIDVTVILANHNSFSTFNIPQY